MRTSLSPTGRSRQTALFHAAFHSALGYNAWLQKFGSAMDQGKWQRTMDQVALSGDQKKLLGSFQRRMPVLCMAGAWCGDCARQCPVVEQIARGSDQIELRFVDRDENRELAEELQVCGAPRVPQLVWMNEDFEPVLRAGDKTVSQYREIAGRASGATCPTGYMADGDSRIARITAEWFGQFELAQLILQTSPKLMQRHGA